MKRFWEKLKIIVLFILSDQYAIYSMDKGYMTNPKTSKFIFCYISDNASKLFLESIVKYTNKVIEKESK